ncbi:DUF1217 domain-containing protein [Rubellimicrobium aerolatum]|uniref:DUF1217 domain-containing protein n=1 Tax=Rubellimicrobium aerolatum TaxID=490979 RepID=A0ABW0S9S9_9RHOB|nr:DUF1217 domain-containing protein [Rubellimicrobium aerolatum]MBP1805063.1 hypothetical protein [Rubellimicrobium aerolatum]
MTYQPVLPLGGYTGWRVLQRTLDRQEANFNKSAPVQRATDYFKANIAKAKTAADLVGDRRLLEVALGAFGLSEDINSKAFLRKVLEGGTLNSASLANKLSDKRYAAFAKAFGYGDGGARTGLSTFPDTIISRYRAESFEQAVGEQDNNLRLALNLKDSLAETAASTTNTNAQWYYLMGNTPLRSVFETALGLPSTLSAVDVDKQLAAFKSRSEAVFGTSKLSDFTDATRQEKLIRLFLVRSEMQTSAATPAAMALSLLSRS